MCYASEVWTKFIKGQGWGWRNWKEMGGLLEAFCRSCATDRASEDTCSFWQAGSSDSIGNCKALTILDTEASKNPGYAKLLSSRSGSEGCKWAGIMDCQSSLGLMTCAFLIPISHDAAHELPIAFLAE